MTAPVARASLASSATSVAVSPGTSGAALLRLEGLGKSFAGHAAVQPVDLAIHEREFVTLLGPSGCGKTTLLRMLAGLERPTCGRILIDGRDITAEPPERRPFNMVFQNYALFPHLDVFGNVAYGLRASRVPEREVAERVRAALAMVGLEQHAHRPVDQLSGGMSQRVALVRAIVKRPRVLLLDEPLAALDLQLRKRMQLELRAIQESLGTTFIHVTHDQEEAMAMSDRIVLMRAGHVVQVGTPREVYDFPRTRFTAEFVGEATLLPCRVRTVLGEQVEVAFPGGAVATFRHHGTPGLAPESPGLVALRPQQQHVASPGPGLFQGTVAGEIFMGAATILLVALDGGARLKVHAPAAGADMRGHRIGIGLDPGAGTFVCAEESAIGL